MMGIVRGAAFIITEGRYYDVSSRLPQGFAPLAACRPTGWRRS